MELGDRMKGNYENRTRYFLPRRTYTVVRIDGKAFHTFTKGMNFPIDDSLVCSMDAAADLLCTTLSGAVFSYTQSDEISVLMTDFGNDNTDAYFDGNIQKICSISASVATAAFNNRFQSEGSVHDFPFAPNRFRSSQDTFKIALFDSRVFTIADPIEVENYFIWRQQDASRNSLQMMARSLYSHKELEGKNCSNMHDMLMAKGINWNDLPIYQKRGRMVVKSPKDEGFVLDNNIPVFTQNRDFLRSQIPVIRRAQDSSSTGLSSG